MMTMGELFIAYEVKLERGIEFYGRPVLGCNYKCVKEKGVMLDILLIKMKS